MKASYVITLADKSILSAEADIDSDFRATGLKFDARLKEFLGHERFLLPVLELRLQSAADRLGGTLQRQYDGPLPNHHALASARTDDVSFRPPDLRPQASRATRGQ